MGCGLTKCEHKMEGKIQKTLDGECSIGNGGRSHSPPLIGHHEKRKHRRLRANRLLLTAFESAKNNRSAGTLQRDLGDFDFSFRPNLATETVYPHQYQRGFDCASHTNRQICIATLELIALWNNIAL